MLITDVLERMQDITISDAADKLIISSTRKTICIELVSILCLVSRIVASGGHHNLPK